MTGTGRRGGIQESGHFDRLSDRDREACTKGVRTSTDSVTGSRLSDRSAGSVTGTVPEPVEGQIRTT